jgi:Fe-S-cluster containining protein
LTAPIQRFACTQCGKCCTRSPEVELSEAAALSDVFVFRLMFRLYCLPDTLNRYADCDEKQASSNEAFYQRKRLLKDIAAHKSPKKLIRCGTTAEHTQYLIISAVTLDGGSGNCSALIGARCSIYDRRPFACRTAPFHYSHVEASAAKYLEEFVRTPSYRCDTGQSAPIVIEGDRIVDRNVCQTRADALALARLDVSWRKAILRQMRLPAWNNAGLPSLREVEADAPIGATTTSMRIAWQIAAGAGLMSVQESTALIAAQADVIERELAGGRWAHDAHQTLVDMRAEYRALTHLSGLNGFAGLDSCLRRGTA